MVVVVVHWLAMSLLVNVQQSGIGQGAVQLVVMRVGQVFAELVGAHRRRLS